MDEQLRHEQAVLDATLVKVAHNLELLTQDEQSLAADIQKFYESYHAGDVENTSDLYVALDKQRLLDAALAANRAAQSKAYFGKIDYTSPERDEQLYIGKKGVADQTRRPEQLIIDWRAPVSQLYYSATTGAASYTAPQGEIGVDITAKATLEVSGDKVNAVYDSQVVTNDALLVQYLSKTKDVVLNEIVATIQKEQNDIIRIAPWKNVLVQGVAGSGKTTVAMHRISYLLYNYANRLTFANIYVVASSKLFLNYITAMLPDLDVPEVPQGTLAELLTALVQQADKRIKLKTAVWALTHEQQQDACDSIKSRVAAIEQTVFPHSAVSLFGVTLLRPDDIAITQRRGRSLSQRAALLDQRVDEAIEQRKGQIIDAIVARRNDAETVALARQLFGLKGEQVWEVDLQSSFRKCQNACKRWFGRQLKAFKARELVDDVLLAVAPDCVGQPPDLAVMALTALAADLLVKSPLASTVKHIVIDEAQDFPPLVYRVLRSIFSDATFTIVGDVCQNISADGLDSWQPLTDDIFADNVDFAKLVKSYRNTIEISSFANALAAPFFGGDFLVEPVVRHGAPVGVYPNADKDKALRRLLSQLEERAYQLCAVICKEPDEAARLAKKLGLTLLAGGSGSLSQGTCVAALKDTKGLEFDAVVLYDFDAYDLCEASGDAKRLYVAMTRALHELHLFSDRALP